MSLCLGAPIAMGADVVTSVPMETDGMSRIKEKISGTNLKVQGRHANENVKGAKGDALRFDGYTTFVEGIIPEFTPEGASSFSIWIAPETYPIVMHDQPTEDKITLAGTIDHTSRSGWAFSLGRTGNYSFDCYAGGWLATVEASDLLPCYEWSYLVAVNDPDEGTLTLYRNGEQVGQAKSLGVLGNGTGNVIIGKKAGSIGGAYLLDTFNGLIDDIEVYDGKLAGDELKGAAENVADLSIPETRFAEDKLRPKYHGMPGANWTNETHGMTYSDGKYHVFFQKNANGPYMSRLHWGHITSDNLYDWTEEKIAIAPGESYDIKGAWSGCVFTDEEITGGLPNIIYTGVDYVKAVIVQAYPKDETLLDWEKKGVIINGRPEGLSDDFRDPYFFRNGDNAYIIVGTSKNGIGATTLHKYNPKSETWSNDGSIFYSGTSKEEVGTFWEMPNITKLSDGKWLFTVTPQNTSQGVHTLYWIGDINPDGTFKPESEQPLDLELINGQGYGLLSPTIYQKDGKTLVLGIVPDKLSTEDNCQLGWAHLYSFPRELSIDEKGNLIQKPYSGLTELRAEEGFEAKDLNLDGVKGITGVGGRQFEVKAVFTVGENPFGFNFFKSNNGAATLTYTPSNNKLEVNLQKLNRKINDRNSFGGRYAVELPEKPEPGSELTIQMFVDGSVLDIFVNNQWATSIRVYPTDEGADGLEVFSTGGAVKVNSLEAWLLGDSTYENEGGEEPDTPGEDPKEDEDTGIEEIFEDLPDYVNIYSINGTLLKRNISKIDCTKSLPKGLYIINDKKVMLK